jgi:hypothetical protein
MKVDVPVSTHYFDKFLREKRKYVNSRRGKRKGGAGGSGEKK